MKLSAAFFLPLLISLLAPAKDLRVSVKGLDSNDGSSEKPFKTISAAALAAQPGDVITVHAGTYRERINPPRGGESDAKRIVYQAAPGEKVEIKGSEVVKNWTKVQDDVWKVVVPNSFFGAFNPYSDVIRGDWFNPMGRVHYTGAVYLDGEWLPEAAKLDDVLKSSGEPLWFGQVENDSTTLWARFKGADPNEKCVEINVRRAVFYPEKTGINFLTVRGFTMRHAATQWAPPTAEQVGLIGTNWSKGWIIENNVISHSRCSGITLGKYGDEFDNKSANSAEGYVKTIERATQNGWNKDNIGHHIVRGNTISDCEQTGICGSLGAVFSEISGNHIHHIWFKRQFTGAEMAGIKIHASIDMLIKGNHIHHAGRGMWMDWMAQGTRISGNLCHDNTNEDLFVEVDHGPFLVDNNVFLSPVNVSDMSEGGAYVHNLFAGGINSRPEPSRQTPYHPAHSTVVAGLSSIKGGDNRFFNNLFTGGEQAGLWVYDPREYPLQTGGNVYYRGARPYGKEQGIVVPFSAVHQTGLVGLVEEGGHCYVHVTVGEEIREAKTVLVTTELLGKAQVPGLAWENPDGSPLTVDADHAGAKRNPARPTPGPFENLAPGENKLKVW